jgi:hypothetical protein
MSSGFDVVLMCGNVQERYANGFEVAVESLNSDYAAVVNMGKTG